MVKVNDVIHSSWGQTMTIHDFYKVLKITDKTVTVQLLKKVQVGGEYMWPIVAPTDELDNDLHFGGPKRCKIRTSTFGDNTPYLWINNCQLAYLKPYDPLEEFKEDHAD